MGEILKYVGIAIGVIVGLVLLFKFIKFLFGNLIMSSILCFLCSIVAIILGIFIANGEKGGFIVGDIIFCTLGIAFIFGYVDSYKNGTYDVTINTDIDTVDIKENESGGFTGLLITLVLAAIGTFVVFTIFKNMAGGAVFYVLPILIILAKIAEIIYIVKS